MVNIRVIFISVYVKIYAIGIVCGQQLIVFNPNADNLLLNPAIYNPAAYSNESIFSSVQFRNRTGALSDVRDLYLDFSIPYKTRHTLGLRAYSEQETSLFNKSKITLQYAYHLNINKDLLFSLGTSAGVASIQFKTSGAGIGGSANGFDLAVAGHINFRKTTQVGIALQQVTASLIQPLSYQFILPRYLAAYVSRSWQLHQHWQIEAAADMRFNSDFLLWRFNLKASYLQNYGFLISVGDLPTFAAGCFAKIYSFNKNKLSLAANYTNAHYPRVANTAAYSISLIFN